MMESEGGVRLPEDIVSLSYWLSRRLPISDREKLSLLALHCPTQRLLRGLLILEVSLTLSFTFFLFLCLFVWVWESVCLACLCRVGVICVASHVVNS